ncbi:hypothetical protein ACH3O9_16940 [Leeuwenhoekiella sp. A16]|uniref:hypothetical protein n=1 Tax=unclassified Leeuwenhoekiella TaxID=2615029 RepID=UPI003A809758
MGIMRWLQKIKEEKDILTGDALKHKVFSSSNKFPSTKIAKEEFKRSMAKLFKINLWTHLPGITATFQLYGPQGEKKYTTHKPNVDDYVRIDFPGPFPENWVKITDFNQLEALVEFTVKPSQDPTATDVDKEKTAHFFKDISSSTFRIEIKNKTLYAYQIGLNEMINNKGEEAGDRKMINTLLAETGRVGFQQFQWKLLTDYLVHKIEI